MNRGTRASTIVVGIAFGFLVTGSGFGNYTTIHQALLFRGWYLFAVFGSAVAVAAAGLALLRRTGTTTYGGPLRLPRTPARPHHLYGAAIFGAGFGLTGTCPGGAVAMVATGGLGGLLVLAGLAGGMWLRGATERPAQGKSADLVVALLGIWRRGAVHVPLFTAFAPPGDRVPAGRERRQGGRGRRGPAGQAGARQRHASRAALACRQRRRTPG